MGPVFQLFTTCSERRLVFRGWSATDLLLPFLLPPTTVTLHRASCVHKHRKLIATAETPEDCFVGTRGMWGVAEGSQWTARVVEAGEEKSFEAAGVEGLAEALSWVLATGRRRGLADLDKDVRRMLVEAYHTDAAVTIQSAWKGWRTRMKYRFDPSNPLGRHVAMREFHRICQLT